MYIVVVVDWKLRGPLHGEVARWSGTREWDDEAGRRGGTKYLRLQVQNDKSRLPLSLRKENGKAAIMRYICE